MIKVYSREAIRQNFDVLNQNLDAVHDRSVLEHDIFRFWYKIIIINC